MNTEQRATVTRVKAMIDLIRCGPDLYPLDGQSLELDCLGRAMLRATMALVEQNGGSQADPTAVELLDSCSDWLAEQISGRRSPDVAQRFFKARAEYVEPLEP
jgi:hypothetical protein